MNLTILKTYCAFLVIAGFSASCKKSISADTREQGAQALSGLAPVPPYTWSQLPVPDDQSYPGNNPAIQVFTTKVDNAWWAFAGDCLDKAYRLNNTTKRWEFQTDYGSGFCLFDDSKYFFSYGSLMYFGYDGSETAFKTFDPASGTKTTLANLPIPELTGHPTFFLIGDNAYMFLEGREDIFYRYHITSNTWTSLGNSPNGKRFDATLVVMDNQVYTGMGWERVTFGGQTFRSYKRDWKVFTLSGYGAAKANFPGELRGNAKHFIIGDNIYVGFGSYMHPNNDPDDFVRYSDLWKYSTSNNTWTRQADYPGTLVPGKVSEYGNYSAFASGNAGYLVTGGINEFWRFSNQPLITTQQNTIQ